jgi:hypothetical protein
MLGRRQLASTLGITLALLHRTHALMETYAGIKLGHIAQAGMKCPQFRQIRAGDASAVTRLGRLSQCLNAAGNLKHYESDEDDAVVGMRQTLGSWNLI